MFSEFKKVITINQGVNRSMRLKTLFLDRFHETFYKK